MKPAEFSYLSCIFERIPETTGSPANSRLVGGKTCPRIANPQTSRTMGEMCTLLKVPFLLCTESALGLKIHGATSIIVITTKQDLSFTWLIGAK